MDHTSALVDGAWAERHLDTPGVVFVETGNSDDEYLKGHVPGTVWIGWDEFQDDMTLGVIGAEKFARLLSAKGIANGDDVVIYSVNANLLAALAYWYFTLYGHESVRLLDGDRRKWELDGRPLSVEIPARPSTSYRVREMKPSVRAMRDDVLAAMTSLGFDKYVEPLSIYLQKYRESIKGEKGASSKRGRKSSGVGKQPPKKRARGGASDD